MRAIEVLLTGCMAVQGLIAALLLALAVLTAMGTNL